MNQNQNEITFYVLTAEQYGWFQAFCEDNDYVDPGFTKYEDGNYYLASGGNTDFLMLEYDQEVNPNQLDYSTRFWSVSTVPSALWP